MKKITIKTNDDVLFKSIVNFVSAMETIANDPEKLEMTINDRVQESNPGTGRPTGPRTCYRAILPPLKHRHKVEQVVQDNLSVLGQGTIKAMVYQHMVNETMQGKAVVKHDIAKQFCNGVASSAERVIGDLVRAKIVASEPVVNG